MFLAGFSGLSAASFRGVDSPINRCMWDLVTYAARCGPSVQIVTFESVQLAFTQGRSLMQKLRAVLEEKTGESWDLYHVLQNALSLGGPANRRRYFFVAVRGGRPFGVNVTPVLRVPNLRDVIEDLESLPLTFEAQPINTTPTWYSAQFRRGDGLVDGHALHASPWAQRLTDTMLDPEITWAENETVSQVLRRQYAEHGHVAPAWQKQQDKLVTKDFAMGFNQLGRQVYDKHARVVTGAALLLKIHPVLPRLLTHREVARIQGFPDSWLIDPMPRTNGTAEGWGKGIPTHCGRWLGNQLTAALLGEPGEDHGVEIGDREWRIDHSKDFYAVSREH